MGYSSAPGHRPAFPSAVASTTRWRSVGTVSCWPFPATLGPSGYGDVSTCAQIAAMSGGTSSYHYLTFSPDGSTLAGTSQDATARIWKVPSMQPMALSTPITPLATQAVHQTRNGLAHTPNGQVPLTAGSDGTAQVWDLSPSRVVRDLCNALSGPHLASQWRALPTNAGSDPC
jgi:WD40 repeat protein